MQYLFRVYFVVLVSHLPIYTSNSLLASLSKMVRPHDAGLPYWDSMDSATRLRLFLIASVDSNVNLMLQSSSYCGWRFSQRTVSRCRFTITTSPSWKFCTSTSSFVSWKKHTMKWNTTWSAHLELLSGCKGYTRTWAACNRDVYSVHVPSDAACQWPLRLQYRASIRWTWWYGHQRWRKSPRSRPLSRLSRLWLSAYTSRLHGISHAPLVMYYVSRVHLSRSGLTCSTI